VPATCPLRFTFMGLVLACPASISLPFKSKTMYVAFYIFSLPVISTTTSPFVVMPLI
jgi:hypothetical protein